MVRPVLRRVVLAVEILFILLVVAFAAALWIGIHAADAAGHLDDLRADVNRVRADLLSGRDATADLRTTQRDAHAADHDTHDPVWFAASWLPPVQTVRGVASVADDLAQRSLPPLVQVGSTVEPSRLRVARNRIALPPLQRAAPTLATAATATAEARNRVAALPGGWIGAVSSARQKVLDQLTSLSGSVDAAARFARIGPDMLGANGLRRYFVGVQNNAETRATGGLVAAYAIVTADHGTIHVAERGNDSKLRDAPHPTVDLGPDYDHEYGNYRSTQRWITSNVSPHFPDAANIWAHLWEQQSGEHIDGSFGVDPVALQSILGATGGSVTVKGSPEVFTGSNLAAFIEAGQYAAFRNPSDPRRKPFLSKVAGAVLHRMLSGAGNPKAIATAMGAAAGGGHLQLWSGHPEEQSVISGTPLAGEIPLTRRPYVSVSIDNATGTKLDYYLERTVTYSASSCPSGRRPATVTVRLDNDAPRTGLPPYVLLRGDRPHATAPVPEKVAVNHVFVLIHVTSGDYLTNASLDGTPLQLGSGIERGHPVYFVDLILRPQVPRTIVLQLSEPHPPGAPLFRAQPLARPQQTHLQVPTCG